MTTKPTTKHKTANRSRKTTSTRERTLLESKPTSSKKAKPKTGAASRKTKTAAPAKRNAGTRAHKPGVSVIIVTRNETALLRECLDALKSDSYTRGLSRSGGQREIFVVDTAGGEHTPEVVKNGYPTVSLFRRPDNLGSARSTNMAFSAANGQYMLLLDPKVKVSKTAVAEMVEYLESHLHVGAVSASVVDENGHPASHPEVFPSVRNEFAREWSRLALRVGVRAHTAHTPDRPESVEWVPRTCMMIRRDALQQVGSFDDGYSMYFTEADWCRRARALGWSVHFHPGIKVSAAMPETPHCGGLRGWPKYQFDSSRRYYFRKHHGSSAAAVVGILHGLRHAADATKAALQRVHARGGELGKLLRDKLEQSQNRQHT